MAHMFASAVSIVLAFGLGSVSTDATKEGSHTYCIVGGGPAGLQLGHFFMHANRDYVLFDRSTKAGAFFRKFPRHRKLISLNKRFVREGRSKEFALRHDWNSLLDVRPESERTPPVTTRSEELFPHADVLVQYLEEFAKEQDPHIRYGADVKKLARAEDGGFTVTLAVGGNMTMETAHCKEVIIAGGFTKARGAEMAVDGVAHLDAYSDVPSTGHSYEGKSVVILGLGNAAMETAQELQKYTSDVHIYARSRELPQGGKGVRFAYQTHYVGDIRAGRTTILDTYLLKSLDSFDFQALDNARLLVIPCLGTRRCVWSMNDEECMDDHCKQNHAKGGQNLKYKVPIMWMTRDSRVKTRVKKILKEHAGNAMYEAKDYGIDDVAMEEETEFTKKWTKKQEVKARMKAGIDDDNFMGEFQELWVSSTLLRQNTKLMDALAPLRARYDQADNRHPKDHVIKCFGWYMDASILDESLPVMTTHKGKYPQIWSNFSAKGVPGLYFAGTLTHGLDFRRSAGGFIHGFRYTARALFKGLEERNYGVPWPSTVFELNDKVLGSPAPSPVNTLADNLLKRINEASGPYQMFEFLGDAVVFEKDATSQMWSARYMEEVPLTDFHRRYMGSPRITWVFRYGKGFYGPQVLGDNRVGSTSMYTAHKSKFLHPHIQLYDADNMNSSKAIWILEDIYTSWRGLHIYSPVVRFVSKALARVTGKEKWSQKGSFREDYDDVDEFELMNRPAHKDCSAASCDWSMSGPPSMGVSRKA